jgi:hypothetical protein
MKMLQALLDESIVDPMPPFTSVDRLIARERRRRRRHRAGIACGAAAAVLAVVGAVAFFGTPKPGAPRLTVEPATGSTAQTATPSPSDVFVPPSHGPETDAETAARLDAALRARVSTVVPGAGLDPAIVPFVDVGLVTYQGYLTFSGKGALSLPSGGDSGIEVYALRPTPGTTRTDPPGIKSYPGILERVFGGCAGAFTLNANGTPVPQPNPTDGSCTERGGPSGTRLTLVQQRYGRQVANTVVAVFPDGSAVTTTMTNDSPTAPAATALPLLSLDQLAAIIADPSLIP